MSVSFQDQTLTNVNNYAAIRQFLEQLKKFISSAEHQNGNVSGGALSDAGVVLLRLKDQLVLYEERNGGLPDELFQKQFNGLLVLIKVVVILQGFVSFTSSKTKFSQILMRKNSSTTLKRKASVAEADCMECIKLILHKTPFSWQTLFENGSNLEVILYSVNSPQLDSKCYALEILLSLLDHPQGFDLLLRALSVIAARQGEYLRMPLIISQLKHGLHTSKLHIQILVVRLLNKLMLKAPSTNHRVMVQCEISLARFSPEYVDRLLTNSKTPLGGTNTLMEELDQWRKLLVPLDYDSNPHHLAEPVQSPYALSTSPQNFGSYRTRNRTAYKNQQGQSTVIKNVEKQRMKRQSEQAEKQRSMYASERDLARAAALDSPKTDRAYQTRRNQFDVGGRMRRVKSESAMITDEAEAEYYSPQQRGLNRFATPRSHSPPVELNAKLSRSTHDLSRFDYNTREDVAVTDRLNSKTSSSARSPVPYRSLGRKGNYSLSPRPATNDARERRPNGGFSYIFPSAPVVNDAEHRRARPSDYPSQRPPSAPNFTRFGEDRPIAPPGSPRTPLASPRSCGSVNLGRQDRNVVYIPINMEEREDVGNQRYDKRRQTDSELEHRMRSSNGNGNTYGSSFGEDVRDALSQFDYLNDYDATSIRSGKVRSGNPTEIYHF
ncbi:hypothetical protein QR680_002193 [Steinernema hermaphroditum]|uniref:GBD/FH3 domain-containing protein n=1 Tax=Steinernema hermaphroditum TaxID=289476 RepID=A0AA39H1R1_9BILA|nr:hypothetical protein QR680_002193 [Steinernema hermaphroditum]